MNNRYGQSLRLSGADVTAALILILIVAISISRLVDREPVDAAASATAAHNLSTHA